jgi:hypothetical protein
MGDDFPPLSTKLGKLRLKTFSEQTTWDVFFEAFKNDIRNFDKIKDHKNSLGLMWGRKQAVLAIKGKLSVERSEQILEALEALNLRLREESLRLNMTKILIENNFKQSVEIFGIAPTLDGISKRLEEYSDLAKKLTFKNGYNDCGVLKNMIAFHTSI